MLDLCGQLSCTATMILVQSSTPSYAQGLGVAYQPYAGLLTARAVYSNSSPEKTLSLAGIRTHDLHGTKLVRYQLSYPAWVHHISYICETQHW